MYKTVAVTVSALLLVAALVAFVGHEHSAANEDAVHADSTALSADVTELPADVTELAAGAASMWKEGNVLKFWRPNGAALCASPNINVRGNGNNFATVCSQSCGNCDSSFMKSMKESSDWELYDCKDEDYGYGKSLFCKFKSPKTGKCLSTRNVQRGRGGNKYILWPCDRSGSRFSANYGRTQNVKNNGIFDGPNDGFVNVNGNGGFGKSVATYNRGRDNNLSSGTKGWKAQLIKGPPAPKCDLKLVMAWEKKSRIRPGRGWSFSREKSASLAQGLKGGMVGGVSMTAWASASVGGCAGTSCASASAGMAASAGVAADVSADVKNQLSNSNGCRLSLQYPDTINGKSFRKPLRIWQYVAYVYCGSTLKSKYSVFTGKCEQAYLMYTGYRQYPKCYAPYCGDDLCQECEERMYCLNPLDCKVYNPDW